MSKKKIIIFDFDGVIIDSWEHAYGMNLKSWPNMTPHEHKSLFNGNVFSEISKKEASVMPEEDFKEWIKNVYYPAKLLLPIYDGIREVIETLAQDFTLVINSSAGEPSTNEILEKAGLARFFHKVYGRETSKDKGEKFRMIMEEYKVLPEECLLITDTVGDVLEAKACKINSLVVTYGYQDRSFFEPIEREVLGFADEPFQILEKLIT